MSSQQTIIPNLFIVGQPKSGSTALHHFLDEHPDIYMSSYKEPSYFCRDFHAESDTYHGRQVYFPIRNLNQYLELFSSVKNEFVIGESSVHYLYSTCAAQDIQQFNPDAKIIMILRDPIDFLYSLYQMNVKRTWESTESFEEALLTEERRHQGQDIPPNIHFPSTLFYAQRARYYDQVKRFFDCFPLSQMKVVIYDDFQHNNAETYRDVLEFLGVDATFKPEFRIVNRSGTVRHQWLNAILRQRWMVKLGYRLIPQNKHVWIQQHILKKLFSEERPPPKLDVQLRARLMQEFAPEVEKISSLLDRDLIHRWGYHANLTPSA